MKTNPTYPINEIFATIQGEASFTGTASIFIRMQGCNVGCAWCDTKHTWHLDKNYEQKFIEIIKKQEDTNNWASASISELVDYINNTFPQIKHIVITGGEPAQYDLQPLCDVLESIGKDIQIETSGTEKLRISNKTWVTLSPKIKMPSGKEIIPSSVALANEIKMPIGKMSDIQTLEQFISQYQINTEHTPIWLQPLSQNPSATSLCINQALFHNWKLSIQTHKYLDIR